MTKPYNSDDSQNGEVTQLRQNPKMAKSQNPPKSKRSQKLPKKSLRHFAVLKDEAQRLKSEKKRKWKRQEMQPKWMQLYKFSEVTIAARIAVDLEIKVIKA